MNAKENAGKGARKPLIIVLAVLAVIILAFLFITGIFPSIGGASSEQKDYETAKANEQALKDAITNALDSETFGTVSEIFVHEFNGEYDATVRVVVAGGFYIPDVIDQTGRVFYDTAEELGVTAGEFTVQEYSKGNTGDMENFINWRSKDGVTGTYSDDTGAQPFIKANATADDIREIVK